MTRDVFAFYPYGKRSSASARYRGFVPCEMLAARGEAVEIFDPARIEHYRAVVLQKRFQPEDRKLAKQLRASGCKVILDISDNHYYAPLTQPKLVKRALRLRRMLSICDGLTLPTQALGNAVKHPVTYVVDDLIDFPTMPVEKLRWRIDNGRPFKLVWFGNSGSEVPRFGLPDLEPIISELNVLAEHLDISLTVISNDETVAGRILAPAKFSTDYVKWQLDDYEALIAEHDACIIPISRNAFTACKSPNRVILALWLGVPIVADFIQSYEPFKHCISSGNWVENLLTLAKNPALADQQVASGREKIRADFGAESIADRWLEVLNQVSNPQ